MENNSEVSAIRSVQREYGLKKINIRYFDDKVVVDSVLNNVSFVLDHSYNANGMDRYYIVDIVKSDRVNEMYFNKALIYAYPFEGFKIADLLSIPGNTKVFDYDFYKKEWNVYNELIKYIYFLKLEIQKYYKMSYHVQSLGLDMPSIDEYVNSIISNINNIVIESLRLHVVPSTESVLTKLGIDDIKSTKYVNIIDNIIEFYINNMGLKHSHNYNRLVPVSDEDRVDVPKVINSVLENSKEKSLLKDEPQMTL